MEHSTMSALVAAMGGAWLGFTAGQVAPPAPSWALAAGGLFGALLMLGVVWRSGPGARLP